jgi:hypothetical protein
MTTLLRSHPVSTRRVGFADYLDWIVCCDGHSRKLQYFAAVLNVSFYNDQLQDAGHLLHIGSRLKTLPLIG